MPTRRLRPSRILATLALASACLAGRDAAAQGGGLLDERNRRFYGQDYYVPGYADSLGLRGHKRCENGGYYGPPQMYSRQYGRIAGYRLDPPFRSLRNGANSLWSSPSY